MVSAEMLDKFKRLYKVKYNISLTNEEAIEMSTALVNLMGILIKPESEDANNEFNHTERREDESITVQTS
jgi:hypothetical protein